MAHGIVISAFADIAAGDVRDRHARQMRSLHRAENLVTITQYQQAIRPLFGNQLGKAADGFCQGLCGGVS